MNRRILTAIALVCVAVLYSCNNVKTVKVEGTIIEKGKLYGADYPYNKYVIVTNENRYFVSENVFSK